ncbi:30S ribosomal protein S17 [Patescibacteria group bacterium]|uniref:Small ribosomal subunit protein uS17 n=1 Tax=candidate division WWE3 bacterium TaxID=2053526 RepID=A0A928TTJ2_UNCKA|nr:30S ribosomal protein S17 [candidate division WWE3 bacterium]MCL4732762.1 30S ribosomal protein S17 [Patescibacteria group bacterium]MDL1952920.1 30S ribosomal protein S17 [Candidatus Uhrbacteria bacterium UHB]RIL00640.1 MAG: 30S ribosomal protein S17 [Candidatus Uhrbacteria bacterium]
MKAQRRRLWGTVISTKMQKTAVVKVDRQVSHPKYQKKYTVSKRYHVHDPEAQGKVGDLVEFEECRPLSKTKCWRYVKTVKPAV